MELSREGLLGAPQGAPDAELPSTGPHVGPPPPMEGKAWSSPAGVAPVTLIAKNFCYAIRTRRDLSGSLRSLCCSSLCCSSSSSKSAPLQLEEGELSGPHGGLSTAQSSGRQCSSNSSSSSSSNTGLNVILKDINLCVRPGSMLVIMGPSGSGKTTLLNALAGRSKASSRVLISGTLVYRGAPAGSPLSSFSTYIMQAREQRMKEVLQSMNLYHCRDTRIGGSERKGLSGGEMKRVALAVELLNNPSLIFLDEPTSGLDAALAFDTIRLLLRLARTGGRTVVCTVHQPRSQLFAMFDELMLLHRGQIVFQGPATQCSSYFARLGLRCPPRFNPADFLLDLLTVRSEPQEEQQQSTGGPVGEQLLTLPSCSSQHPKQQQEQQQYAVQQQQQQQQRRETEMEEELADGGIMGPLEHRPLGREESAAHILMEAADAEEAQGPQLSHFESHMVRVTVTQEEVDRLPAFYQASPLCAAVAARIDQELQHPKDKQAYKGLQQRLQAHRAFLSRWVTEFLVIMRMTAVNFVRNPLVTIVQLLLNTLLGFIVGAIFWKVPESGPLEIAARNMLGCIFFLATHIVFAPLDCLSLFAEDRELFNRDTANGTYTPFAYFMAKSLASMPFQHLPLTAVLVISYWMSGMSADFVRFVLYLVIAQLSIFASTSFLFFAASISPRLSVAQSFSPVVLVVILLVCGFYIREQDIPSWIRWLKYISFIHYPYLCFTANEFNNNPTWEGLPPDFLSVSGGLSDTRLGPNLAILATIAFVLRAMAFIGLKYCNRRIGLEC
ncbi:ABC transporter, putative [Eimeria necatrix]|uniref:ABC transporter, putative n=1 Tax=Eimeria necatrix TaxID=51315 RepID=U6N5E1_9EIME|nr:ABC transporter, putative [Eimeria necatrix]CDJ69935.1 ABC transporter, putative [Eimeria necatrix]